MNFTENRIDKLTQVIPKEYLDLIKKFSDEEKYGTVSLVFQKGKLVGCDIIEKRRSIS